MAMLRVNKFKRHGSGAINRVHVTAGGAETAVTAKRNKLKMSAIITAIHSAAKGRIATIDHLFNVFDDC